MREGRYLILFFLLFFTSHGYAQGIRDSVFYIREVQISSRQFFKKENAGLKDVRIDSVVLQEKLNQSLGEVLAENSSVHIKNYGRGALSTASFRGTAPAHTKVSWNGLRINSPMLGMVDFSLVPVYIIDDLNIKHGAASVGETSGGLGGLIQMKNTVDWNNRFSAKYYQVAGSYSTFDEFAQINVGNKKVQSKTRGYHNYSANDYIFRNKNLPGYPLQKNTDADYQKYGLLQEFYIRPASNNVLSARLWYQNAERSVPSVLSDQSSDSLISGSNRQYDNSLKMVLEGKNYGNILQSSIRSGIDIQELDYIVTSQINGFGLLKPVNSGSEMFTWYNQYSGLLKWNDYLTLKAGMDFNFYDISTLDTTKQTGYDVSQKEFSFYTAGFFTPWKSFNFSLQLRKDWLSDFSSPVIYSFGLSYKPFERKDFVFKSNFIRNYHTPGLNDRFWQPGGNPDLLPEEGYTLEYGFYYLKEGEGFRIENEITAYLSCINNWILWLPGTRGYWEPFNLKTVRTSGIENHLKVSMQIRNVKLTSRGNYMFTRAENLGNPITSADNSADKQLPYIPLHSGNFFMSLDYKGYYLNYQYSTYSKRYLLSSNKVGTDDDSGELGLLSGDNPMLSLYPYHMNHLTAGKGFSAGKLDFTLELKVNNLFNETYRSVLQRFMPGRNYALLVKIDF